MPLANESVDVCVFCLSLMGTNLADYLWEAKRVLKKPNGVVKVRKRGTLWSYNRGGGFLYPLLKTISLPFFCRPPPPCPLPLICKVAEVRSRLDGMTGGLNAFVSQVWRERLSYKNENCSLH